MGIWGFGDLKTSSQPISKSPDPPESQSELDSGFLQLTYCTNIHPADGWSAVDANIRRIAPALKARLSPAGRFGLGLRLSAREAHELLQGQRLDEFKAFLDAEDLYVAILNGFPYGPFHGTPVKAQVYAPDWRDEARVAYTFDLIEILGPAAARRSRRRRVDRAAVLQSVDSRRRRRGVAAHRGERPACGQAVGAACATSLAR